MKIERKQKEPHGEYMKRQLYMMSSLGLFYIIIIALFGIPLLGTFVVVMIKGALDFRYLILGSGIIACGLAVFYAGKCGLRFLRKLRADGARAFRDAAGRAGEGRQVQLELLGGLMTFSYGGRAPRRDLLPGPGGPAGLLMDLRGEVPHRHPYQDPVDQLQNLVQLKKEGVIDAAEFRVLKKKLIQNICDAPDMPMPDMRMPDLRMNDTWASGGDAGIPADQESGRPHVWPRRD